MIVLAYESTFVSKLLEYLIGRWGRKREAENSSEDESAGCA